MKSALIALALIPTLSPTPVYAAQSTSAPSVQTIVDAAIVGLMAKDGIPGMAVGVTLDGESYVANYGIASKNPRKPVTDDTLFELGSLSKTFTATAAAWAEARGRLSLDEPTDTYMPEFTGTPFGSVRLFDLATHTPGGFPLQVPDGVTTEADLIGYLKRWRPQYEAGTYRTYSNVSIGMLGVITAKSMGSTFGLIAQQGLFPALSLKHTFIDIPAGELPEYAWGYSDKGEPRRMALGTLWREAYGVRTTVTDMIRFVQENIDPSGLPATLAQAITETRRAYFEAGPMTQDLIWEQYPYPVSLSSLLEGNGYKMIFNPTPVRAIARRQFPQADVWVNKTGSTGGFGAYAAFIPSRRIGVVLLANRSYPIPDRVRAAYRILSQLDSQLAQKRLRWSVSDGRGSQGSW